MSADRSQRMGRLENVQNLPQNFSIMRFVFWTFPSSQPIITVAFLKSTPHFTINFDQFKTTFL